MFFLVEENCAYPFRAPSTQEAQPLGVSLRSDSSACPIPFVPMDRNKVQAATPLGKPITTTTPTATKPTPRTSFASIFSKPKELAVPVTATAKPPSEKTSTVTATAKPEAVTKAAASTSQKPPISASATVSFWKILPPLFANVSKKPPI